jgi:uncharacterized protein YhaN
MELAGLPPDCDTTELSEQLSQIPSKKQSGAESKRLRRERDELQSRIQRALQALPLWNGTGAQLETARVPLSASVSAMATRFTMQEGHEVRLAENEREIRSEIANWNGRLVLLEQQGAIPTDEELAEARARRDLGWTAIKDRWLNRIEGGGAELSFLSAEALPLPQAFETAIVAADSVADQLRREANRVEQKRSTLNERQEVNQRVSEYEQAIDLARQERQRMETEWTVLWSEAGVTPRTPLEMLDWLDKRNKLVEQMRDLRRSAAQVAEAEQEEMQWREALGTALGVSPEQQLAELVVKAKQRVTDCSAIRQKRTDLLTRKRDAQANLETELQNQKDNELALDQWGEQWKAAIREAHLSETADASTAQELIATIKSFWTNSDSIKELSHRIETMREDEAKYTEAVRAIALRVGLPEVAEMDVLAAVKGLQTLARTAHENEQAVERNELERTRKQTEFDAACASVARCGTALDELRREANAADTSLLPDAIERSKRKGALTQGVAAHLKALASSAAHAPIDTFLEQVQAVNSDMLPVQLEQLGERAKQLEVQRDEKSRERDDIERTFKMKEAAIEINKAACEKNSAAARIEALTSEYLHAQIGAMLLEKAIARYRAKHQDPILKGAGGYFAALTCGSFSGLTIDYENTGRVLKGTRVSGTTLSINEMSDGTRDQLFLALRLAYIENHCTSNAPCPVILDDVLMAFDDERASAALKVLRSLSNKTQVLVFTHHAHHVKLAASVLGSAGFQLHELAPSSAAV